MKNFGGNIMKKTANMTSKEMREYSKKNKTKIKSQLDKAPEFDELPFEGKRVGRGFASFKEYINRKGRPKAKDPKVSISIRIPLSKAAKLRKTGPGWQTRTSDFVVEGIDRGILTHG
jgi:uncharacterized protein (DUF4415 family)